MDVSVNGTTTVIANSGPQFITNLPTLTVIYNLTPTNPYTKSKLAVARTVYHRIDSHIKKSPELTSYLDITTKTLTLNGFPARFTYPFSISNGFPDRFTYPFSISKTDKPASTQFNFFGFTTLPCINSVSDKIKRIILETGVKVVFKPFLTIRRPKGSFPKGLNK